MGKVTVGPGEIKQVKPDLIEKIVYVEKRVEVPGPAEVVYVDKPVMVHVLGPERIVEKLVEVPGPERVIVKEVEKIVEIPKIQVVEKPYEIIKEVYNIEHVLSEKRKVESLSRKLKICYAIIALTYIGGLLCLM